MWLDGAENVTPALVESNQNRGSQGSAVATRGVCHRIAFSPLPSVSLATAFLQPMQQCAQKDPSHRNQ